MSNVTEPTTPQQYPQYPQPAGSGFHQTGPTSPKRGWPTSATVTVAILSLVTLISIGAAASGGTPTPPPAVTTTVTVAPPQAAAPTTTPATVAPAGPLTSFKDGTYEVGTAPGYVSAGKYRTTVPTDPGNCYWERLRGLSGQFTDIIANGNHDPGTPVIVTIAASDKGFKSQGCGTWTKA
jgi:hypothetical protein